MSSPGRTPEPTLREAHDRVRRFLKVRAAMTGQDPEVICTIGGPEGRLTLRASDLDVLLNEVRHEFL